MIISETELFRGINYKEMEAIANICHEEVYIEGAVFSKRLATAYKDLLMTKKSYSRAS